MKKSFATKVKALVLALSVFSCSFAVNPAEVKAATNLNMNQPYSFTLKTNGSCDFTFQTPASGYFKVDLQVTNCIDNDGKHLTPNPSQLDLSVDNQLLDTDLDGSHSVSHSYAYAPGKTGSIHVIAGTGYAATYYYKLTVVNETPANFESEDNNTAKAANKIVTKKLYSGILNKKNDDEDWYLFKAPKTGNYKFYIQNTDDAATGDFFYVTGYKSKTKVDKKNSFKTAHAGKGFLTLKKVKLKKGKKYFIRISSPLYESIPYEIKVKKVK
ncbi:hypothetical protein [Butyrivibrio sp. JL13D10]|uniref:hypothetical protein n=1 Tax=Butyrivibrio sp. JL13D10 TaxID=3236815 RepID=UPI0038B47C53